ncbi:hypothetical protein RND81_10G142100 [Saponaria officinalis]|uniref:FHA domain-containing protein n=1 Tax=Saponaria officinalis TaxID=3572 RepID=A0AAW1I4E4_SAPOF
MVALPPATPWISKDDLLLKTAIEAGASLESLARGAVQFSRRFTIKELQDRWHTLLYDPIISAEATARMVEFERSSKANKADNSKEAKCDHGKRKAESIRRCYYATRKRICNEPLNQGDLSFLVASGDSCFMTEAEGPGSQTMLGDPMQSHYGFEGANFDDLHNVFPDVMRDSVPPCSVGEFPSGQPNTLENPIQQNILHQEVSQMDGGGTIAMAGNCSATAQAGPSVELPGHDIFQANGIQADSVCDSKGIMCPGFGDINSSISECETSFHHFASSPPAMPDWKSNDGISVPERPEDGNIRGNDMQAGDLFCVPGDADAVNRKSEYDIHAESELNSHMSCAVLKDSTGCKEGYFAELSDSLFNFTSDDEMLMIDGGKDVIDKTYLGLSSLLLNSPNDPNEDTMPDMPELKEPASVHEYHGVPLIAGLEGNNEAGEIHSEQFCDSNQINSQSQIPTSPGTENSDFPEIRDGVIWCTLNTEDPEIPCNDCLPLPSKPRPHSALRRTQSDANNSLYSGKDSFGTQATMKRDAKRSRESHTALLTTDLDATLNRSVDDYGVKFEGSRGETHNGLRKSIGSQGGMCQSSLVAKNESSEGLPVRQLRSDALEKFGQGAAQGCVLIGCSESNREGRTMLTTGTQEFYALDSADPLAAEPGGEPLLSEDEQFSESDTDIPCFSDIESMILDMDLGPEEHDSFYHTEVAKYQHEDAKRVIIRLEQNAHSYIQRALTAHGAFAILYGRHSKHFIKKPEVLLGRGTNDVPVDIDLSREGRANKISRRQAIIKMEKEGTFILRNMGKCSIYVNNKEVIPGLTLGLHSNCLIEIRGMPFIFETNQASVKKYLDNTASRLEAKRLNV